MSKNNAPQTGEADAAQAKSQVSAAQVAELQSKNQALAAQLAELQATHDAQVSEIGVLRDFNERLAANLEAAQGAREAAQRNQHAGQGTHLRVSSAHPAGSHWRAGRQWAREPQDVEVSAFTAEQIAAMRADRHLVVVDL